MDLIVRSLLGEGGYSRDETSSEGSNISSIVRNLLESHKTGDYEHIFNSPIAKLLLGHEENDQTRAVTWDGCAKDFSTYIDARLSALLFSHSENGARESSDSDPISSTVIIGYSALEAFIQSNVSGPPLPRSVPEAVLPSERGSAGEELRKRLVAGLAVDGAAAYQLVPDVELFCLAKIIFGHPLVQSPDTARLALRVTFLHQRLLTEQVSSLQSTIYRLLEEAEARLGRSQTQNDREDRAKFLIERAAIQTYYGFDVKARHDLDRAAAEIGFVHALTGRLGKRTKFQEKDTSQLVVLARSVPIEGSAWEGNDSNAKAGLEEKKATKETAVQSDEDPTRPKVLDLNDDTLLDSISFSKTNRSSETRPIQVDATLPPELADLDVADQPPLKPLESIILLSLASSITNTSPADGLTREETMPYATRVLDGGSNNWQIYTQALLIRSRIEAYKSRTFERSVLQLQALVDQVIAETTPLGGPSDDSAVPQVTISPPSATTFLPRADESESAPVTERLRYIFQLLSPTRWELEAELAARWISLGGIKTALEIYERLQMWAEIALCWAGMEREDKARAVIRRQLFECSNPEADDDSKRWDGPLRDPLPADAPRLCCILGDIDQSPSWYEKAWSVSKGRYTRAQRSLGKYHLVARNYASAAEAYEKALKINQLNHGSWYALGCARLQLGRWDDASEAFIRAVQLDDGDAESWSNLAAALLEKAKVAAGSTATDETGSGTGKREKDKAGEEEEDDDDEEIKTPSNSTTTVPKHDPARLRLNALKALKRASSLQYDNWRIWENVLVVAARTNPPSYTDMLAAFDRISTLRGQSVGEKAVDVEMLSLLVRDVMTNCDPPDLALPPPQGPSSSTSTTAGPPNPFPPNLTTSFSIPARLVRLLEEKVIPLITSSPSLWSLIARYLLWRRLPDRALEAYEKSWRAAMARPGWTDGAEVDVWREVVERTEELVGAYETLLATDQGKGEGEWKFKARSALRAVLSRGRDSWEGGEEWIRLNGRLTELKQ